MEPPTAEGKPSPAPSPNQPASGWSSGYRLLGLVGLVLGGLVVLLYLHAIASVLILGFLIAFLIYGPVQWLTRRMRSRRVVPVALIYGLIGVLYLLVVGWGTVWLIDRAHEIAAALDAAAEALKVSASQPASGTLATSLGALDPGRWLPQVSQWMHQLIADLVGPLATGLSLIVGVVALVGTALFFAFWLELHLTRSGGALRAAVPEAFGDEVAILLGRLDGVWVGYIRAMVIYGGLLIIGSLVMFVLLGVPYPVGLAVFNGLITLIPSVGGLIGSIVTGVVCIALGSTKFTDMSSVTFGILVLTLHFFLVQITYNFIALPIVGRYIKLPVWAVLVGVLASLAQGNVLMAFIIPPLFSTGRLVGAYVLAKVQQREPFPSEAPPERAELGFFSRLYRSPD